MKLQRTMKNGEVYLNLELKDCFSFMFCHHSCVRPILEEYLKSFKFNQDRTNKNRQVCPLNACNCEKPLTPSTSSYCYLEQ